ncbi:MAG: hypothetical protein C5B54_05135, partial [Acidobacteria bacterium]
MSSQVLDQPQVQNTPAKNLLDATVILLTFNGEQYLSQVLQMLDRQKVKPKETVVIDSGSTDHTLDILQSFEVRLHKIPNSEFSHSKTRNLAVRISNSNFIVFLTQDATPADSCWLEQLLLPFQKYENVAGVYGRQAPRPSADPLEANDLRIGFPPERKFKTLPKDGFNQNNVWQLIHFSNASSAYRRELLMSNPFREDLEMAEDQEWAMRMMKKGYSFVYEPESIVLHSHDFTLTQKRERDFRMGRSFAQFLYPLVGKRHFPLGECLYHIYSDAGYMNGHHQFSAKWLLRSPIYRA